MTLATEMAFMHQDEIALADHENNRSSRAPPVPSTILPHPLAVPPPRRGMAKGPSLIAVLRLTLVHFRSLSLATLTSFLA